MPFQPQIAAADAQLGFPSEQEAQHPGARERLRQNGRQCRAAHAHAEAENKDGIQNDVGHRTDEHRQHARAGKALGGDESIHAQRKLDKDGADCVQIHVGNAVFDRVFTCAKGQQEIPIP